MQGLDMIDDKRMKVESSDSNAEIFRNNFTRSTFGIMLACEIPCTPSDQSDLANLRVRFHVLV